VLFLPQIVGRTNSPVRLPSIPIEPQPAHVEVPSSLLVTRLNVFPRGSEVNARNRIDRFFVLRGFEGQGWLARGHSVPVRGTPRIRVSDLPFAPPMIRQKARIHRIRFIP
jgi:hypothetical protein